MRLIPTEVTGVKTWSVKVCTGEVKKFVTKEAACACEKRSCGETCRGRHELDRIEPED
jgi:hypothetical protein